MVSRESVRIALLLAGLNELEVRLTDIGNAYLTAATTERCYIVARDEFGPDLKGRVLKIVRALYGLKSAGASFHAHLANVLRNIMHFMPCEADPDVWRCIKRSSQMELCIMSMRSAMWMMSW